MSKRVVGHSPKMIQNLFVLLLLSLFAVLSTFLVTMGAQLYRNTVESAEKNSDRRIMSAIVRSAIWAEDGGEVMIEHIDEYDITSLTIINRYELGTYYNRLYVYDHHLLECFTMDDILFDPEYGEELCPLEKFEPSIEGKVLTVNLETSDHTEDIVRMYLRAGGAEQ